MICPRSFLSDPDHYSWPLVGLPSAWLAYQPVTLPYLISGCNSGSAANEWQNTIPYDSFGYLHRRLCGSSLSSSGICYHCTLGSSRKIVSREIQEHPSTFPQLLVQDAQRSLQRHALLPGETVSYSTGLAKRVFYIGLDHPNRRVAESISPSWRLLPSKTDSPWLKNCKV